MTDKKAVSLILMLFTVCLLLLTRIHNPQIFFIAEGDDVSYFAYARAVVLDRDFKFAEVPLGPFRNGQGKQAAARYSLGPGVLWSPFFLLGHAAASTLGDPADERVQNGTSNYHWLSVCIGSLLYGLAGFVFLYFFLRRFFPAETCLWTAVLVGFSSPVLYYLLRRPLMAHSSEFFCLNAAAYFVSGLTPQSRWAETTRAALLTAFIFLVRWNDAPYVVALSLWAVLRLKRPWLFLGVAGVAASLQLLLWKYLVGSFYPGPAVFGSPDIRSSIFFAVFPWTFRHLRDLFVGKDWGIFWLSPVTLLTIVGWLWIGARRSNLAPRMFLFLPALPVCWIAANWPSHGGEFGNRYLLPLWILFAFLFAEILDELSRRQNLVARRTLLILGGICLVISLGAMSLFKSNSDTLTLHVGPTLYEHPSDWVNHAYTINAYREMTAHPIQTALTLGPSPAGYFLLRAGEVIHAVPASAAGKLNDYFLKHGAPSSGAWAGFFFLYLTGASFIRWIAVKSS